MKYITTEIKEITVTSVVEAPNAALAMMRYKKDSSAYSVDYCEQSDVKVYAKSEFIEMSEGEKE